MNKETFDEIKKRMKLRKFTLAEIARSVNKSSSFIGQVMRGNYPYEGKFGMPEYLYDYLILNQLAKEDEISWNRPMTSDELKKYSGGIHKVMPIGK